MGVSESPLRLFIGYILLFWVLEEIIYAYLVKVTHLPIPLTDLGKSLVITAILISIPYLLRNKVKFFKSLF